MISELRCFIRDGCYPGIQERSGELERSGEVKISKKRLTMTERMIFGSQRFFYFDDEFCFLKDFLFGRGDMRARLSVLFIREPARLTSRRLHPYGLSSGAQRPDSVRRHADAIFVVLDLFRHADHHNKVDP